MCRIYFSSVLSLILVLISCHKQPVVPDHVTTQSGFLKEIVLKNLPSPYYHFDYDGSGSIQTASFASGEASYTLQHNGNRISEVKNTSLGNKDRLGYVYENDKVVLITVTNQAGIVYKRCFLTYDVNGRLEKLEWDLRQEGVGFANQRTLSFSYYADGNLSELIDHRHPITGIQPEAFYIDRFENYDDRINVDGFSLLHQHNEHLILLPGVKLQKNNPGKNTRLGDGINYVINYTYTYESRNLPTLKKGDAVFTNGSQAGQHFETESVYSYY